MCTVCGPEQAALARCFQLCLALGGGLAGELASEMLLLRCAPAWLPAQSRDLHARGIIYFGSSIFHSFLPPGTSVVRATLPHAAISLIPPSLHPGSPPRGTVRQGLCDLDQLVLGNLHSSEICKQLWTLCHPQEFHL